MKTRDKAYYLLGKALVWTSLWGLAIAGFMWALTRSIYF